MKRFICLFVFFLCSFVLMAQNTIYVSTEGEKEEKGTREAPFRTIEAALKHVAGLAGKDTVYIHVNSGLYLLDKTIRIEKTPAVPIVIEGDERQKPVISGAIALTSWEKTSQGWWKTHIDEVERYGLKVEQLYVNGERAIRARTPDEGWFLVEDANETVHYKGTGRSPEYSTQRIQAKPEDLKSLKGLSAEEINNTMVMCYHNWDNTRKYLSYAVPDSGYFFLNGKGMQSWNSIRKGSRFILENYKQAMTTEGEWFLEASGDLYYIPREGEKIEASVGYAPILSTLLSIQGGKEHPVQAITFRNLSFEHSGYVMPETGDDPAQAAAPVGAAIHLDYADNILFENCEIKHTGNYAIWFRKGCTNCKLEHSYLTDLGAGGVKIGEYKTPDPNYLTRNIVVNNNIIQKTGFVFPCGAGVIIFHSPDNKVTHNEISDLLYSGVSVGWVWGYGTSYAVNNKIAYNHIHHIGWGKLSDMGAVYTLGVSPGTHIHHNTIHHIYSYDYGGWGLYTDEGSTHIVLEDNLVYGCKSGGFHQHYGKENILRNNIFAFNHYQQLQFTRVEEHRSFSFISNIILMDHGVYLDGAWDKAEMEMDNNCYWDLRKDSVPHFLTYSFKDWKKLKDKHSIVQDPGFKDPYRLDFRFKKQNVIRKIGFKPFDYTEAGVYGDEAWKQKARLPKEREEQFNRIVKEREKTVSSLFE
ncbi:right-handed parallel beta-helix repeat-containing protein [Parabacteroides sp. AM08-6]|uniref:right-handed parallel beta-helix repeat-containing protein n=1 Tax=Parabacteroides sp. AM08-6 TaxID=2292053 RepID=UPI000EFEA1C8|nr:right-handed parallel beta-helix repeat-containing protein [Parabacteroides sp. AM08-6]RHJ81008.1 right-handed parallel beta-helix repeat-containing protein [Parabacteroides sp. AM08-6]